MVTRTSQNKLKFTYTEKNKSFSIPFSVKASRFLFKISSRISERISSKFAYYLFFRPRKLPYKNYDLEIMQKAHEDIIKLNNRKIHVYSWGPNTDKKALFVHGWEGRATSSKHFLPILLEQGYQVYSYDAPAHGKSEGKTTDLPEFIATLNYVIEHYGSFEIIIAHSFGSLTTLHALQTNQLPKKLILVSSISDPFTAVKGFQKNFELTDSIMEKFYKKVEKHFGYPMANLRLQRTLKLNIPEVLVIHDKHDNIAPLSESIFLEKLFPESKLMLIENAGHHKILSNPKTIEIINQSL